MTFAELATDAYIKNGLLAPGETLGPELAAYAMREANRMIGIWNIESLFVWTTNILTFALTARTLPTYWYTIGPTGADFTAPRPTRIERANLLLTASTPNSRVPLEIVNDLQWSDETVPSLGTTIPNKLYNDGGNPNSRLYVWPYPTVTQNYLELFTWNQIAEFAAVTDSFAMPPGYQDAFMLTLAERTAEGVREISATLRQSASLARAAVKSLNSESPKMSTTDSGMPRSQRTNGNFYNGWSVTPG